MQSHILKHRCAMYVYFTTKGKKVKEEHNFQHIKSLLQNYEVDNQISTNVKSTIEISLNVSIIKLLSQPEF